MNNNENNINKLVIFDWGGVIESHVPGEYNWRKATIELINTITNNRYSDKEIIKKWNDCSKLKNGKSINEIDSNNELEEWFENISKVFEFNIEFSKFVTIYQREYDKVEYYSDVVEYIHSLRNRCKIAILSNLSKLDLPRIDSQCKLDDFDYVWLSFKLKCKKPESKIYEIVTNDSKYLPKNILFIDDNDKNIEAAKKEGWNTCLTDGTHLDIIKEKVEEFLNK